MAQLEEVIIRTSCPYSGHKERQEASIAIANTGADDGGISEDEDGVSYCLCRNCGKEFQVVLQCFATVRKCEDS